jgi:uncharacterized protein
MKFKNRAVHRDLGYFFLGLIISFSLSGILLNHRQDWHLTQYTVSTKEITVDLTHSKDLNSDTSSKNFSRRSGGKGKFHRRNRQNDNSDLSAKDTNQNSANKFSNKGIISETFAQDIAKEFDIKDKFRRQFIQKAKVRLAFENHNVEIDLKTGKGRITEFRRTPVLGQIVQLHRDNSVAWICYSDIFAISLITIAITGVIIPKGKKSFAKRGWMFSLAGIIFPLIILFFIM